MNEKIVKKANDILVLIQKEYLFEDVSPPILNQLKKYLQHLLEECELTEIADARLEQYKFGFYRLMTDAPSFAETPVGQAFLDFARDDWSTPPVR